MAAGLAAWRPVRAGGWCGLGLWQQRGAGPFQAAAASQGWPVLHSHQFPFSLFLRRKHRPVTSMRITRMAHPPRQGLHPEARPSHQPPCPPARRKVGQAVGAEDGMLAAPSRAWSLPSANLGLRPGWEPDFWAINPCHTPPPLPAPQNTRCSFGRSAS